MSSTNPHCNMNNLPFYSDPLEFAEGLLGLRLNRRKTRIRVPRQNGLTRLDRIVVHSKTEGKCHVCGVEVSLESYQADHVKSHSQGGTSYVDNFLPACNTCNNYRWDYGPHEIQWILKLGIWTRKQIEANTDLGNQIAAAFTAHEIRREKRRKKSRFQSPAK